MVPKLDDDKPYAKKMVVDKLDFQGFPPSILLDFPMDFLRKISKVQLFTALFGNEVIW